MSLEKLQPHNIEAEQSLLGAMLLSPDAIAAAVEIVEENSFYALSHKPIYKAIVDLWMDGQPADAVTVAGKLGSELEKCGGKPYIHTLISIVPAVSNADYYARIVRGLAQKRALVVAGGEIAALGHEAEAEEAIDRAESIIFGIAHRSISERTVSADELFHTAFNLIEQRHEHRAEVTGIPSGISGLDNLTAGWQKGDLVVLAARPAMGKTALALHFAVKACKAGIPTAFFSIEMSKELLAERVYAMKAGVNSKNLRTGYLTDLDWKRVTDASGELVSYPLFIDDTPALSLTGLRAKARRIFARVEPGLVIVDYLQLMQSGKKNQTLFEETTEISKGLKILAKELGCPVIALSQMSRKVEERVDRRPMLADLRQSGQIEQDADIVMFIHRDRDKETGELKPNASLIVSKHRSGPCGTVKLYYHAPFLRFTEEDRVHG